MQAKIRGYPNGETRPVEDRAQRTEKIGVLGERGELKHLSTRRKREYSLSSGERKGRSPNRSSYGWCGVVGPAVRVWKASRRTLERSAIDGESPVDESQKYPAEILSTTGHEEPCGKLGRPLSKAKYP